MAEDTYQLISQLQEAQTSDGRKDLWDFGSYPERKGNGLLFEKEVLAIQVGKYQKCEKSKIFLCWRGYVAFAFFRTQKEVTVATVTDTITEPM